MYNNDIHQTAIFDKNMNGDAEGLKMFAWPPSPTPNFGNGKYIV